MRCPVTKFITHTTSHMCFLVLLAVATFRVTESDVTITDTSELTDPRYKSLSKEEKIQSLLKETLRPASTLITHVQICIVFWILGECSTLAMGSTLAKKWNFVLNATFLNSLRHSLFKSFCGSGGLRCFLLLLLLFCLFVCCCCCFCGVFLFFFFLGFCCFLLFVLGVVVCFCFFFSFLFWGGRVGVVDDRLSLLSRR